MLFPIDQFDKKAELSNVIKNEGLNGLWPLLWLSLKHLSFHFIMYCIEAVVIISICGWWYGPDHEFEARCFCCRELYGHFQAACFKDPLALAAGIFWWNFLQGDYNGEEIAKVMELVELEEAQKKRQAGWGDLLGWKQNRFRCHLPSEELLYQSKGLYLTCGMCRIGLECVTEWCWSQSGISTPTAYAPQPPLALTLETRC